MTKIIEIERPRCRICGAGTLAVCVELKATYELRKAIVNVGNADSDKYRYMDVHYIRSVEEEDMQEHNVSLTCVDCGETDVWRKDKSSLSQEVNTALAAELQSDATSGEHTLTIFMDIPDETEKLSLAIALVREHLDKATKEERSALLAKFCASAL